jgi:hypothetical protein
MELPESGLDIVMHPASRSSALRPALADELPDSGGSMSASAKGLHEHVSVMTRSAADAASSDTLSTKPPPSEQDRPDNSLAVPAGQRNHFTGVQVTRKDCVSHRP